MPHGTSSLTHGFRPLSTIFAHHGEFRRFLGMRCASYMDIIFLASVEALTFFMFLWLTHVPL